MFEYKNDFLMGPKHAVEDQVDCLAFCHASRTAEKQLAELADLVGSGSTLTAARPRKQIDLVDDAPALEFDLEGELSRAFGGLEDAYSVPAQQAVEISPAVKNAFFDTSAIEAALSAGRHSEPAAVDHYPLPEIEATSTDMQALPAEPVQVAVQEPVHGYVQSNQQAALQDEEIFLDEEALSDSLAEELDRALAEEVASDFAMQASAEAQIQSQEQFDLELARLMGEEPARHQPVVRSAPTPEIAQEPWQSPEIMHQTELPDEPVFEQQSQFADHWTPPQTSDFDAHSSSISAGTPSAQYHQAEQQIASAAGDLDLMAALQNAVAQPEVPNAAPSIGPAPQPTHAAHYDHAPAVDPVFADDLDNFELDDAMRSAVLADQTMNRRRSGRKAAFAIVAVALLGGTAALGWNLMDKEAGPAPTLLASSEPIKVKPKDAGGKVVPNQDQAVYQSVDGGAEKAPVQQRLKDSTEKPINVAVSDAAAKIDARVAETDNTTVSGLPVKPRRVRTVVVKPDGTIVSSTQPATDATGEADVEIKTPTLALQPTVEGANPIAKSAAPARVAFNAPKPVAIPEAVAKQEPAVEAKPVEVKTVAVKPVEKPKPAKVVARPEPKPVAENLASVSSPYAVQIASQRTPEAAKKSYSNISGRYASILGGKGVDIRKVDLTGKGTYYRVRIPAQSKAEANDLCARLKSAGGACFVTR